MSLITDTMVEKAILAVSIEIHGRETEDDNAIMRAALTAIAPDIWNAAVERCAEEVGRERELPPLSADAVAFLETCDPEVFSEGAFIAAQRAFVSQIRSLKHQPSGKE